MGTERIHLDVPKVVRTHTDDLQQVITTQNGVPEALHIDNGDHSVGCAHVDALIMRTCDVSQMVCAFGDATGTGRAHLDDLIECAQGVHNQMSCA